MRTQLSQILVENYNLNEDIFAEAQRVREEKGGNIGNILVQQKGISETQLLEALSNQYDLPYWPILPLENVESEFIENLTKPWHNRIERAVQDHRQRVTELFDRHRTPIN